MEVGQLRLVQTRWRTGSPWVVFGIRGLHRINVLDPNYDELCEEQFAIIRAWCIEQFGQVSIDRWLATGEGFCFSSDSDATAFKIRWC